MEEKREPNEQDDNHDGNDNDHDHNHDKKITCGGLFLFLLKKSQVVQPNKRMGSTMSSHVGFNSMHEKHDKMIAGGISVCLAAVILVWSIPSLISWFRDDQPYLQSVSYPYDTTEPSIRPSQVPLRDLNRFFYKVGDFEYNYFTMEEMEEYLDFKVIEHIGYHQRGTYYEAKKTHYGYHTCNSSDFNGTDEEREYYRHFIGDINEKMICMNQDLLDNVKLEGNRDYMYSNQSLSYFKFDVSVCSDQKWTELQKLQGKKCKTREEIDAWRYDKTLIPLSLEKAVNFRKGTQFFKHQYNMLFSDVEYESGNFNENTTQPTT